MKCTITIADNPDRKEQVNVNIEFDPPLTDQTQSTSASAAAMHAFKAICAMGRTLDPAVNTDHGVPS